MGVVLLLEDTQGSMVRYGRALRRLTQHFVDAYFLSQPKAVVSTAASPCISGKTELLPLHQRQINEEGDPP